MSVISWGRCTLLHAPSINGLPVGDWTEVDVAKESTFNLSTNEGDTKEAREVGGKVVDKRKSANSYTITFQLFRKKGQPMPSYLEDNDGVIAGEHAWRIIPEDPECDGYQIDRSTVSAQEIFDPDDTGGLVQYTVECLKPGVSATNPNQKTIQIYVAGGVTVDQTALILNSTADTAVVNVTSSIPITATAEGDATWITPTVGAKSGDTYPVEIAVSANADAQRTGTVLIVDENGRTARVTVMQASA